MSQEKDIYGNTWFDYTFYMVTRIELLPVFFIGARASGKGTVGALTAKLLHLHFVDTDQHIRASDGREAEDIVAFGGWTEFRALESVALRDCTAPDTVIASGGGIVLAPENRAFMRASGIVFFLDAPAEILRARLLAHPQSRLRPSLTGLPVHEEVERILTERTPLYRAVAHYVMDASQPASKTARKAASIIIKEARNRHGR